MKAKEQNYEILFLDCNNNTLIKRFKETRRSHPMGDRDSVENEINEERAKLEFLREQADYIIDTSNLLVKELRGEIEKIFVLNRDYRNLFVTIIIFRKILRSHHPAEDRIHIRRHKIVPALSLNNNRRW